MEEETVVRGGSARAGADDRVVDVYVVDVDFGVIDVILVLSDRVSILVSQFLSCWRS